MDKTTHELKILAQEGFAMAEIRARKRLEAANIIDPMLTPRLDVETLYIEAQEYQRKLNTLTIRYMNQKEKPK